jgi:hypothetical protein
MLDDGMRRVDLHHDLFRSGGADSKGHPEQRRQK